MSSCQKTVSETKCYLSTKFELLTNLSIKNHNLNIPLILDKCNIMVEMQKLKFMQEFTFAINVECLHSSLHAKLLMHNCAGAKHAKRCFCSIYRILKAQSSGKQVRMMHIYKSNK